MTERWTDETLDRFAAIVTTTIQANSEVIAANNERMSRIEQDWERSTRESNERMSRIEQNWERSTRESNERLARTELLADTNSRNIAELSQLQLRMIQEFAEYRRNMAELRADFRETTNTQTQILHRIDEMQAEVRGLQTENRHILDHLFGQQSN